MYLLGHMGVTLAVYAPLAYRLVRTGRHRRAAVGAATLVLLACGPDVDSQVAFLSHRGLTHTVWAALVVGAVLAAVWGARHAAGSQERPGAAAFGFLVGAMSVTNHLVGDVITPMGVRPLYPLVDAELTLSLFAASDPTANLALLSLGVAVALSATALGWRRRVPPIPYDPEGSGAADEPVSVPVYDGRSPGGSPVGRPDGGYARRSGGYGDDD